MRTSRDSGLPAASAFNPRAINLAEGVRAALSMAVIVAASEWIDWPPLMEGALAAWLTCLCDAGGPIRRRVPFLLGFGLAGGLLTGGLGLLAGTAPLLVMVAAGTACVLCTSMLRVYGQAAMQVGNLLTVVTVLSLARDLPDLRSAALYGGVFLGGSLWALLLTMVIWRVYPYRPAQRAGAEVWRSLAMMVEDLRNLLRLPEAGAASWERHAREHRRTVRAAIETAREVVMSTVRARGPDSPRAAQSLIRLESADQIFGALIALSELLETDRDPAARLAAGRMLRRLQPTMALIGRVILADSGALLSRLERAVAPIAGEAAALPEGPLPRIIDAVAERLRIALAVTAPDALVPGTAPGLARVDWRTRLVDPLVDNLDLSSAALRHALRTATAAALGFAVTLAWPTSYGYWLTITLLLTMQPTFALTVTRAAERIVGTALGGGIASGLGVLCTTKLAMAAALFPLAAVALAVRAVNFGLFMAGLTPVVVVLVELARPGANQEMIAVLRAVYTLAGGLLALLFNAVLWPAWEPGRLGAALRATVRAHGRYACATIDALLGDATQEAVEQARRAAGLASNNLEASLQRVLLEPVPDKAASLDAALAVDAALRRLAGRASALHVAAAPQAHARAAWQAWRDWIGAATGHMAAGESALPKRPPLPRDDPDAESLARMARQLELAAGALPRVG